VPTVSLSTKKEEQLELTPNVHDLPLLLSRLSLCAMPDAPIDTSRIYAVDCEMVNVGFEG